MTEQDFPRLLSTGAIACLWQRPVKTVERSLAGVGAVPVFALNDCRYFSSADVDRGLLRMCESEQPKIIHGPPTGPVVLTDADGDEPDEPDGTPDPPRFGGRLDEILERANHG